MTKRAQTGEIEHLRQRLRDLTSENKLLLEQTASLRSQLTELNKTLEIEVGEQNGKLQESNALLKASEESLRLFHFLIDHSSDAIHVIDPQSGVILWVNEMACAQLGYSRDELRGMAVFNIDLSVPDLESYRKSATGFRHGARPGVCEHRFRRKDGTVLPVEVSASDVSLSDENYRVTMVRDITERKLVEAKLRESEERYRMLAEAAQDSIFIIDGDGRFQYINRFGAAQLQLSPEEIVGQDISIFFPPDAKDKLMRDVETVRRIGSPLFIQHRTPLGKREAWLDTALVPLSDNDGNVPNVLGVARDITWRKQNEDAKIKLELQLYQAQKMEAVGRLAGGVAHEFNNLLTAVLGYSDLALKHLHPENPLHREILEIQTAAEGATSLTQQLLAFSRKQVRQTKVIDVAEVILDLQRMLGRLLGDDILLDVRCTRGAGHVLADPGQIQQVVLNLAVNARDAMAEGGTLSVQTERVEHDADRASLSFAAPSNSSILLTISDTGCGMDLETQSHLFEPFFTTKPEGKGSGLGLAIVHGIISQSGGHIEVLSEPGCGTTVKIYLPEYQGAPDSAEELAKKEADRGDETILLVEDSIQVRVLTRKILASYGYRVLEAADGMAAIDLARRERGKIHLLLTDVVMPGMSGRTLADQLTAAQKDLKVLFMSGYTDDDVIRHLALDPACNFIPKPFRPETLASKVREVLEAPQKVATCA